MIEILTTNLAASAASALYSGAKQIYASHRDQILTWVVFLLCLLFSSLGVGISFFAFGAKITGIKMWGIGIIIAVIMLGLSYGAKYANAEARKTFTPVDLIQYLSQGFLWPSTWPALADFLGVQKVIAPPQATSWLLDCFDKVIMLAG